MGCFSVYPFFLSVSGIVPTRMRACLMSGFSTGGENVVPACVRLKIKALKFLPLVFIAYICRGVCKGMLSCIFCQRILYISELIFKNFTINNDE